jgi:ankyrin repeat protein
VNHKGGTWGRTPLHVAVKSRNIKVVEYLLNKGALQFADNTGKTPLSIAVTNYDLDPNIVELLCKHGADVNHCTPLQDIARRFAAATKFSQRNMRFHRKRVIATVKLLLTWEANPRIRDSQGKSPLEYAVACNFREMIDILEEASKE